MSLAALLGACAGVPESPRTALMKATKTEATSGQLRADDDVLAVRIPGRIEAAADEIMARSPDPAIRHRALAWKAEAVPAFYQALFEPDPLVAVVDAWALAIQIEQDLEGGPSRGAFGELQPVAVEAARRVLSDLESTVRSTAVRAEAFEKARSTVAEWARANPIDGPLASRPSVLPLLARMAGESKTSLQGAVGSLTASFGDLATRIDIYAAYLPKAARWQMELAGDEVGGREAVRQALADLGTLGRAGAAATALMSDDGIRRATAAALEGARAERIAILASIDRQRVETLDRITREREAAFAAVETERVAVTAAVDRQRTLAAEQVEDLRRRTLADLDALATRIVWRAALAIALLLLGGAAAYVVVARASRPRGGPAPAP